MLGLFYHGAELLLGKKRLELGGHFAGVLRGGGAVADQVRHAVQLPHGSGVVGFNVIQRHVDDEDDFLPQVVKGDELIKQHQVHIAEAFGVSGVQVQGRLKILDVVISKVADKAARKRRQIGQPRAFIFGQHGADGIVGVGAGDGGTVLVHRAVQAGELQLRLKAQKGVAPPLLVILSRFQQKAVAGYVLQDAKHFDGRFDIGQDLGADGQAAVLAALSKGGGFGSGWTDVHGAFPLWFRVNKKVPDRTIDVVLSGTKDADMMHVRGATLIRRLAAAHLAGSQHFPGN